MLTRLRLRATAWIAGHRKGARDERGDAVIAYAIIFSLVFFATAGLVIDGGYALGAKREAMNDAEQAARVGADALNTGALRDGQTVVDSGRAVTAAQAYLNSVGANGTVSVHGGQVTVTVTGHQDTTLLKVVMINAIPIKATATALSIDQDD
ncbi:TadE/TadG family type IV pilus assembly protein [Nocardioides sp. PD653-B2]|uniref:TadE/TadG family type IV pilus assembly protein n=1 Tax=Nocardioides sp. PD653-B2 TaxID=1892811 RepID=UPI001A98C81C|nr:pilus assembly protein TadG-related protein [Nocardioides sp. PD653-B2]